MDSSLIDSIGSAVHHLDRGLNDGAFDPISTLLFRELKIGLWNLKALLIVCISNAMESSPTLSSLFSRIQDAVGRICGKEIPVRYEPRHASFISWMYEIVGEIHGLAKEADGQVSNHHSHGTLTADEVVGIAGSILNNWPDFHFLVKYHYIRSSAIEIEVIDAFELHILFLKCFLQFATRNGVELHDLLLHIQPVAMNAARIFVTDNLYMYSNNWLENIQSKCSVANGMAVDSRVSLAYSRSLSMCALSSISEDDDDDALDILKNFLDSLISLLWDFLRHSDFRDGPFKVLYERLRFCRTILKNHFDAKFIKQIGGLICSAGALICSLYQTDSRGLDSDLGGVSELIQRFAVVQVHVEDNASRASEYNSTKAIQSGLGDFMNIMDELKISDRKAQKEITPMLNHLPLKTSISQVAGFQDDEVTSRWIG